MDAEKKALVFDVVRAGFAPAELDGWNALTGFSAWSEYLDACETIANDECSVLTDVLSSGELMALRHPLGFEEVRAFAARHFTGGLPQSAVPVESLYRAGDSGIPAYGGASARYMGDLIASMGLDVPERLASTPDHVAVEAGLAALLYRSDGALADSFVSERFTWLADYRLALVALNDDDRMFFCALIDVVLALVECVRSRKHEAISEINLERK